MFLSYPIAAVVVVGLLLSGANACIGEFERCSTGDCVLISADCGKCPAGQYLCPSQTQCVSDTSHCDGIAGTIWDWTISHEQRVEWLVNQTTLQEKILQLQNSAPSIPRLSIPAYQWLNDDLHGLRRHRATSFPNGCGLGATWDKKTLYEVGKLIAVESRAMHHFYTNNGNRGMDGYWNGLGMTIYGPNVNLVRDPRWGRNQEVFSEDPRLTSILTEGYVTGMQFEEGGYMTAASCCKHYAVYDVESFPTARYFYNAVVDGRNLWETYLPVFEACVRDANVAHIMCSYNSVNGVPACGNSDLLNGILRGKWNFTGFVVSDYDAWAMIYDTHFYCPNMTCAAATGINAGCDQEGGGNAAISELPNAVALGLVDPETISQSFRRLFRVRVQLGMFDPPSRVPSAGLSFTKISDSAHMQQALDAAREAICMYTNKQNTLPLTVSPSSTIAVIGGKAGATTWLQGNYAEAPAWGVVSILEGILNANAPNQPCQWDTPGVDYHLDNDTFVAANSAQSCAAICSTDLSCNFFTYVNGRCYVMPSNDNAVATTDTSIASGGRPGLCIPMANVDFTTSQDQPVLASDARECCQLCRATPNCSKYTYNALLGCYLNPSNSTGHFNELAVSGGTSAKVPNVLFAPGCLDGLACANTDVAAASAAAAAADAVVLVIGLDQTMESEGHDRTSIFLPIGQYQLATAVRAAAGSKPLIVVMVHGGTFALGSVASQADALIDAWYPGQQGGNAVADVIYGNYNPAGRATATYYSGDSELPANLAQQDLYAGKGLTYRYYNGTPVIPFGLGLSYTTFQYSNLSLVSTTIGSCDNIVVTVDVINTGSVIGDEVVQLYLSQVNASVPVPNIRLGDFTRVRNVAPGEKRNVILTVTPAYRAIVVEGTTAYNAQRFTTSGTVNISVGGGQPMYTEGVLSMSVTTTGGANMDTC